MQLKIAFYSMVHEGWTVGEIYQRNLFYALRQTYGKEVGLYLLALAGPQNAKSYATSIEADDVFQYNMPQRWTLLWVVNGFIKRLLWRDVLMERFLKDRQINVLFGSTLTYGCPQIAILSWLPDFQHVHLPEMFSKLECISRNRTFLNCAKVATRIILMSEAVKKDFELFAPMYAHKASVLHPISYVSESIYERDPHSILSLYHLPEKFVYLPNQFWKHKNHEVVFEAVKVLKGRGIKVVVVCTGNPVDYRHPTYFAGLCSRLSEWNIRDQIIYLGLIPREHVLHLMRQSICVLNPSLFEGWGYTVDETRSVGKQVLLSDIPAHREQNPPKAMFFNPYDCNDLAEKLGQIWLNTEPGPDVELECEARHALPDRLRAYGEAFFSVAQEAFDEIRG
jgi:glycosyltransferase involved in cell wall biosynthesis